ncbi:MAG: chromosomal replication initiator protein DnaA [Clostridia bacterium]|nr:chromosomal replication initiator protein DnaA [Clostridia bacterium]
MNNNQNVWKYVLEHIHATAEFPPATFSIWFRGLQLEELDANGGYAYISAEKHFMSEFVFKQYEHLLKEAIFETLGARVEIVVLSRDLHSENMASIIANHKNTLEVPDDVFCKVRASEDFKKEPPLSSEEKKMIKDPVGTLIKSEIPAVRGEEYTFDNFIVGDTNRMAHDACMAIAKNPVELWNPLFIYAPSGMGKTHLLYAISNEIIRHNPSKRIRYVRGEDFTNDLIDNLMQKKPMHYFRERYREVDVLLVDDIQFIAGKESTQQEFFHTFDTLYQQKKQIIITCDCPPKELKNLNNRMMTRFESGLTVDIQPPELELRIAIANSKAASMGLEIPSHIIQYIAENIKTSVRQLEGLIKRIHGYATIYSRVVDMDLVNLCIHDMIPVKSVDHTVEKTFQTVCDRYNVGVGDITGKRKNANIVTARHVATYILRQITDLSSVEIARYFSQDHSTILSAIKNVEKKIEANPEFEEQVSGLIHQIQE